jgi:hypothetical protein
MTWQLAVVGGAAVGGGLTVIARGLWPSQRPDPVAVLDRLDPAKRAAPVRHSTAPGPAGHPLQRLFGTKLLDTAASSAMIRLPRADLALLGVSVEGYVAMRLASGMAGLIIPILLTGVAAVFGLTLPFEIPAVASLAVALVLFVSSDQDVRRRATAARREFRTVLQRYMELVALERASNVGAVQALEDAGQLGQSWVLARINQALLQARLASQPPWDLLSALAAEVEVPALRELSNIMRASGEEGAAVYRRLLARSDAMRIEIQTDQRAAAEEASERMIVPMSLLAALFVISIIYPMATRIH